MQHPQARKNNGRNHHGRPAHKAEVAHKPHHQAKHRVENSAGGVVIRRMPNEILVGFIKDSYGKWTFPKGRVKPGEDVGYGAERETREEMGIVKIRVLAALGTATILFKDRYEQPGTTVKKYISYFLMETDPLEKGKAENKSTGERVTAIRWVPYRRAAKFASYKNVLPIIRKAVALIEESEKLLQAKRQN